MKMMKAKTLMVSAEALMIGAFCVLAQSTGGELPASAITSQMEGQFSTIWGVAKWIMQAILVITGGIVAFKTATSGHGSDKTGGWLSVIAILLVAIALQFVPTIAKTLFGINF
jgi:hypothetical protein